MIHTTNKTGFMLEADRPAAQMPMSNDELVIAYTMVSALYQLVQRWSRGEDYDARAQAVAESAERLLLRSDVLTRILRIAGLERRNEFMVDHIELLEQQKQQLLKALRPFAQLIDTTAVENDPMEDFYSMPTATDLTRARLIYNMMQDSNDIRPIKRPEAKAQ